MTGGWKVGRLGSGTTESLPGVYALPNNIVQREQSLFSSRRNAGRICGMCRRSRRIGSISGRASTPHPSRNLPPSCSAAWTGRTLRRTWRYSRRTKRCSRRRRKLVSTAIIAVLAGCRGGLLPNPSGNAEDLARFIAVPVEERLAQAKVAGDLRFLGVYDYALSVPGVPDYHEEYWPRRGVLPIPGTSDFPHSERESELNDQARAYALEYNRLLLRRP